MEGGSKFFPVLGIVLSLLTWIAAVGFLGASIGDPYHENPEELARIRERAEILRIGYLGSFLSLLVASTWIAGVTYSSARLGSFIAIGIHAIMIATSLVYLSGS